MGPILYIVMEGDLHTLSQNNILFKYADDTNLLVPANSDVSLLNELEHVKQWAADNRMIINIKKTKEIVFQRPSLKYYLALLALFGTEQVTSTKLLGVIFKCNRSFDEYVRTVLKLNVAVNVLIYLNYFETRECRRNIWILYFMHLLCLRFGMLHVPGAAF